MTWGTAGQPGAPGAAGPVKGPAHTHMQPAYHWLLPSGSSPVGTRWLARAQTTPSPDGVTPAGGPPCSPSPRPPQFCRQARWVGLHLPQEPGPRGLSTVLAAGQASDGQYQPAKFQGPHLTRYSRAPEPWVSQAAAPAVPRPGCLPTTHSGAPGGRKGRGEGTHRPGPQALQGQTLVQSLVQGPWQRGLGLVTSLSGPPCPQAQKAPGQDGPRRVWKKWCGSASRTRWVGGCRTHPPTMAIVGQSWDSPPLPGHRPLTASRLHRPGPPPGPRGANGPSRLTGGALTLGRGP